MTHPATKSKAKEAEVSCRVLARDQHGLFSRCQAAERGLYRQAIKRRLVAGILEETLPGVYRIPGVQQTWEHRLMSICLFAGPKAVASHRAAARLLGLDGPWDGHLEISVPPHIRCSYGGATLHQIEVRTDEITLVKGIPSTTATRTVFDLASVASDRDVELALDSALRLGLLDIDLLRKLAGDDYSRRWGAKRMRRVLSLRSSNDRPTESALEVLMLRLIRRSGLPEPELQFPVRLPDGSEYRIDFAYSRRKVAIEVDGYAYHSGRQKWQSDISRSNALTSHGWQVIRVTYEDIKKRADEVVDQIRSTLRF